MAVRTYQVGVGVAELLPVGGGWLLGGLVGGGAALLAAAAGRGVRDMGGRGGASVLAVAVMAGGGVASLWTWVEPYVERVFPALILVFPLRASPAGGGARRPCGGRPRRCRWLPLTDLGA